MIRTITYIALLTAALTVAPATSYGTELLSLHNSTLGPDVDGNGTVTENDLYLVFDVLRANQAQPLVAPLDIPVEYYWDTSNNGRVNSQDALVVINYLLAKPVPEPGSVVTATAALVALGGLCWRRRVRRPAGSR